MAHYNSSVSNNLHTFLVITPACTTAIVCDTQSYISGMKNGHGHWSSWIPMVVEGAEHTPTLMKDYNY